MELGTADMTLPYGRAAELFSMYRMAMVSGRGTPDDALLARALKAMLRGRKLIDLPRMLSTAGVDDRGRPRLAIARADWRRVYYFTRYQQHTFWWRSEPLTYGAKAKTALRFAPTPTWPVRGARGEAIVPPIPPNVRPRASVLHDYHILFEAEWTDVPVDPLLLRHVAGPFWSVLAAWDLTPLEQGVLRASGGVKP